MHCDWIFIQLQFNNCTRGGLNKKQYPNINSKQSKYTAKQYDSSR